MRVIEVIISVGRGGAETVVHNLSIYLLKKGTDVKLIISEEINEFFKVFDEVNIENIGESNKTPNFYIKNKHINLLISYISSLWRYLFYNKKYIKKITDIVLKYKPQILHMHLSSSLLLLLYSHTDFGCPVVFTMHGDMQLHKKAYDPLNFFEKILLKKALRRVNYVTSACTYFFDVIDKAGIPLNEYRKIIIPNGIEVNALIKPKPFKFDDEFTIIFVGGARHAKGGDVLVKSLPLIKKRIKNFKLYILRNVPENHFIRTYVLEKKLTHNVKFVGYVNNLLDYYRYIKSADLAVLPSRTEGIAQSILEFMACGKPIVATKVGGTPEIIKNHENGILVDLNPESIANGIIYLYENPDLMINICKNNLNESKKYSWDVISDKYISFFNNIISNG